MPPTAAPVIVSLGRETVLVTGLGLSLVMVCAFTPGIAISFSANVP
jgi:hypothetical protein